MTDTGGGLVWYASYGSNLHRARFDHYRLGGTHPGGTRDYPGFRDPRPPLSVHSLEAPGVLYFATESPVWGGGRAFWDPDGPGSTAMRGYLLRRPQFSDLLAQEMFRRPGEAGPEPDLDAVPPGSRVRIGPGRYETLVHAGARDGVPILTFTAPWGHREVGLRAPSAAYLRHLGAGLREAHGWAPDRIGRYLAGAPGAAGAWSADRVTDLVAADATGYAADATGYATEETGDATEETARAEPPEGP